MADPATGVQRPTLEEIEAGAGLLRDVVRPTSLVPLNEADDVLIKPEIHQVVG